MTSFNLDELDCVRWVKAPMRKPVAGFARVTAPPKKHMNMLVQLFPVARERRRRSLK